MKEVCTVNEYGEYLRDGPAMPLLLCNHSAMQTKDVSTLRWSPYTRLCQFCGQSLSARKCNVACQNWGWDSIQCSPFPQQPYVLFYFHGTDQAHHRVRVAWFSYKPPNLFLLFYWAWGISVLLTENNRERESILGHKWRVAQSNDKSVFSLL